MSDMVKVNANPFEGMSAVELELLAAKAKAAAKAVKKVVKLPPVIAMGVAEGEYEGKPVPAATIVVPLMVRPSIENGYGKLLIGDSTMGNSRYVAVGTLPDGRIVEGFWSFRTTPPKET